MTVTKIKAFLPKHPRSRMWAKSVLAHEVPVYRIDDPEIMEYLFYLMFEQ